MFIQLRKNGEIVLIARTGHAPNKDHDAFLPVIYGGDTSLLHEIHIEATPKILENDFSIAAGRHKLTLDGDYEQYIVRKSLTLPERPSQEYLDSLGPDDIIY